MTNDPRLPQVGGKGSPTPKSGQPYDFNAVQSGVLIPFALLRFRKLRPGARMLWGVIRARSYAKGYCFSSVASLAKVMGVTERPVRLWIQQLEEQGFLATWLRPGMTARRKLLWHDVFNDQYQHPGSNEPGGVLKRAGGAAQMSTHSKVFLEVSSESVSPRARTAAPDTVRRKGEMLTAKQILQKLPAALTESIEGEGIKKPPLVRTAYELSQESAIEGAVNACGVAISPGLFEQLHRKQKAYGVNGFRVAAAIQRALKKIAGKKSLKPNSDRWILAVVENELSQEGRPSRREGV